MRVKQVDAGTTQEWIQVLRLPLKVRAEVCKWLYETLRVGGGKHQVEEDAPAELTRHRKIGRMMEAGDMEGISPPGKSSEGSRLNACHRTFQV